MHQATLPREIFDSFLAQNTLVEIFHLQTLTQYQILST